MKFDIIVEQCCVIQTEAVVCVLLSEGRGPTLQSSRSLDALSDLKLQRLEAELEGARHQAESACQREKELRAELQRLQQEVAQLQEAQRQVGWMITPGVGRHWLFWHSWTLMEVGQCTYASLEDAV